MHSMWDSKFQRSVGLLSLAMSDNRAHNDVGTHRSRLFKSLIEPSSAIHTGIYPIGLLNGAQDNWLRTKTLIYASTVSYIN